MYQRVGSAAYKADLLNTLKLVEYLGKPHHSFKTVHVAGTNGKGSTSHMLASVFQEAGFKVGLYTSPHLKDFRERIKINGDMIPKVEVSSFVKKHKAFFEENKLSFFEMTVGLAFDYFSRKKVDIAIIEVGLGGRLDSTNIIVPEISVITNIGLDHTQFLGDTLSLIAAEKAGIIKHTIPIVIGETVSETKEVFLKIALSQNAPITFVDNLISFEYDSDLKGNYQEKNKRTVLAAITILKELGWKISQEAIMLGFRNTIKNTGLMGRWQILQDNPKVVCDTAHNRDGLIIVLEQLKNEVFEKLHIVLGVVDDKDLSLILPLFPKNAMYYFCKPDIPRGFNASVLKEVAADFNLVGEVYPTVNIAFQAALNKATKKDLIYVGGSTFVVAEVL